MEKLLCFFGEIYGWVWPVLVLPANGLTDYRRNSAAFGAWGSKELGRKVMDCFGTMGTFIQFPALFTN